MKRSILSAAILGALGLGSTFSALAANNFTYQMCVGAVANAGYVHNALNGVAIWGYAEGGATNGVCDNPPTLPGPTIRIPDADAGGAAYDGLTVSLVNTMPRPTSLVIPGTVKGMKPTYVTGPGGLQRVMSFDKETPADAAATVDYKWDNLPSGSYMYHSGTRPQLQVQMGLYGGVVNDFEDGAQAYEGKPYTQDVAVFYSEIDPALHAAANLGTYDLGQPDFWQSTINYDPKIFLLTLDETVGGQQAAYDVTDIPVLKISPGIDPLFRIFNTGQRLRVPTVANATFDVIARDGKELPNVATQYSISMPPLKVKDAVLNLTGSPSLLLGGEGSFRLTDGAMNISNPGGLGPVVLLDENTMAATDHSNENCMSCLKIEVAAAPGYVATTPSAAAPIAVEDRFTVQEDGSVLNIISKAVGNDVDMSGAPVSMADFKVAVVSEPTQGTLVNDGGSLHYQHGGGENEHDSIVYSLTNAAGETASTSITLSVAPVNDAPVAESDSVTTSLDNAVIEIRALNNDNDVDSDAIRITSVGASSLGELQAMDQVIVFKPAAEGSDVVTYQIEDTEGLTASADISITVAAATAGSGGQFGGGSGSSSGGDEPKGIPPVALQDTYTVVEGGVLEIAATDTILGVLANDTGAQGVDETLKVYPEHGEIVMLANGTFTYTHDGSEDDSDRFVYEAYNADGKANGEVIIQVKAKMDPPKVNNDKANTKVDTAVLIDLLRNDKDGDSALDPNGIVITKQPQHGTVDIVTAGEVRYTPDAGYTGKDNFRYRLKDSVTGEMSKRAAKVKIRIKN